MSDNGDEDIDDVVDCFFDAREVIFEHVGYVEDWRVLPIDDSRDQFWTVDEHEREWVKFSPSREAIVYWLDHDDYGPHGDKLYENEIYTQRHLSKWVYRGKELTIVIADTNTDGNQYLQLFRNENEVRPGTALAIVQPAPQSSAESMEHPLNDAIESMIEHSRKTHVDSLHVKVREMCAAVPPADLQAAIAAHRANCQQPGCPVLAAMEAQATEGSTL